MDYNNLIAASINLDIDYVRMTNELLSMQSNKACVPFSYPAAGVEVTAYSLFLRTNPEFDNYSYRGAKSVNFDSWNWDSNLTIPYTRSIIDSLPFSPLAAVRVVYFPDVPCMEHTDWDDTTDLKHTLGLSIIPNTGNTYCNVWSEKLGEYRRIPGNAMLLNDSIRHNVPCSNGTRITMRLFGKIDYSWFTDKINHEHCYYLN